MERRGIDAAAADRRRDDQPRAHRREDRARRTRSRRCTCSTPRARSAWCRALLDPERRAAFDAENRARAGRACATCYRQKAARPLAAVRGAPTRRGPPLDVARRGRRRARRSSAAACVDDVPLDDARAVHRLALLLHRLGAAGPVPRRPRRSDLRRGRARAVRRRAGAARRIVARAAAARRAACTASGRRASDGDDIVLYTDDDARRELAALPDAAPAGPNGEATLRTAASPTSSRRATRASPITSAPSRSPPASAPTSWSPSSRREHDDYNAIMAKALADRLAEAFAE